MSFTHQPQSFSRQFSPNDRTTQSKVRRCFIQKSLNVKVPLCSKSFFSLQFRPALMLMFAVNAFTAFVLSSELLTFVNPRLQLQVIFQTQLFYKPFPPTWPLISYIPLFFIPPLLSSIGLSPPHPTQVFYLATYVPTSQKGVCLF